MNTTQSLHYVQGGMGQLWRTLMLTIEGLIRMGTHKPGSIGDTTTVCCACIYLGSISLLAPG